MVIVVRVWRVILVGLQREAGEKEIRTAERPQPEVSEYLLSHPSHMLPISLQILPPSLIKTCWLELLR